MEDQGLPNNGPNRPVSGASQPQPSELDVSEHEHRSHTPFIRLAIVTGILLPMATIPYILSKKRISGLRRTCDELNFKLNVVQRQLNTSFLQMSVLKDEQTRMEGLLHDMKQRTADMEQKVRQQGLELTRRNEMVRSDLRKILEVTERMRTRSAAFETIGPSLADIAAFMQEMELRMGLQDGNDKDGRGIHRLRLRALEMQKLLQKEGDEEVRVTDTL